MGTKKRLASVPYRLVVSPAGGSDVATAGGLDTAVIFLLVVARRHEMSDRRAGSLLYLAATFLASDVKCEAKAARDNGMKKRLFLC